MPKNIGHHHLCDKAGLQQVMDADRSRPFCRSHHHVNSFSVSFHEPWKISLTVESPSIEANRDSASLTNSGQSSKAK